MVHIDGYIDDYCNNRHICFNNRCSHANINIELMQWNLYLYSELNVSSYNEHAFRFACLKGNIEFARWLLSIKPDIDVSAENDWAFIRSCMSGQLEMAQFIYTTAKQRGKPVDFNVIRSAELDIMNGYLDVEQWILSIKPTLEVYTQTHPS